MTAVKISVTIVLLLILVLLTPINFIMRFNADEVRVHIKCLFFKYTVYPKKAAKKPTEPTDSSELSAPEKKKKRNFSGILKLLYAGREDILNFARELSHYCMKYAIKISEFNFSFLFGTDDPTYTGMICGLMHAVVHSTAAALLRRGILKKYDVDIVPSFDEIKLDAGMYVRFKTRLLHAFAIVFIAMKLAFRLWRTKRRNN